MSDCMLFSNPKTVTQVPGVEFKVFVLVVRRGVEIGAVALSEVCTLVSCEISINH